MLDLFLKEPTEFLIKIDTDTEIHRQLQWVPSTPCCFGTLYAGKLHRFVQGGCIGYSLELAECLYREKTFLQDDMKKQKFRNDGKISEDRLNGYAIRKLNKYPFLSHPEVFCTFRFQTLENIEQFAITHPNQTKIRELRFLKGCL
jgi:hypothetical protein